jgi:imidazolonepropionase-like amidohydrolase
MTRHALLLGAAVLALAVAPGPARAETDLYTGFTLIDPEAETRTPGSWLLIEDGQIAAVGQGAPPAADETRDMSGLYALPGFIDGHAHITVGPQKIELRDGAPLVTMESDDALTRINARWALAYGVTTIRNPGGDPVANARYDANVASGAWVGPEALHAGAVVQPPPFGGSAFAYPRTEAEWDAEAARQAELGMTYFKLYLGLSEDELAHGVRAAKAHGLTPIAHLDQVSWARAVELGVEGLEHALPTSPDLLEPEARAAYAAERDLTSRYMYRWFERADYDGPLIRELIDQLAERRVVTNMTLVVNEIVYNIDDLDAYMARFTPPPEVLAQLEALAALYEGNLAQLRASATGWTAEDFERARAVMPKVLELTRRLHDAGVPMLIGTDGAGGGLFYARELELHVQAGIPAWEVLRMATSGSADILGLGDRTGRISEGKEADVAFLTADPSIDIANANTVEAVLTDGAYHRSADLIEAAP